jgi:hypothetical protein
VSELALVLELELPQPVSNMSKPTNAMLISLSFPDSLCRFSH